MGLVISMLYKEKGVWGGQLPREMKRERRGEGRRGTMNEREETEIEKE